MCLLFAVHVEFLLRRERGMRPQASALRFGRLAGKYVAKLLERVKSQSIPSVVSQSQAGRRHSVQNGFAGIVRPHF
jgi:hypothetical protein